MASSATCLCCFFIIFVLHNTNAADLRLYQGSLNSYISAPLKEPSKIVNAIDKTKYSVFYTFGFNGTRTGPATIRMISVYISLDIFNVFLVDWEQEAKATLGNIQYPAAVLLAKQVATDLGDALVYFIQNGVNKDTIYLTGHSVGAHIMGMAGERTQKSDVLLPWITGLDPAGPIYQIFGGMNPSNAKYVEALHTNPGNYGIDKSVGHIDFWANCGNDGIQPGCDTGATGFLNDDDSCSHNRPWMFYAEALLSPDAFPASCVADCSTWKSQSTATVINYLGLKVDQSKRGNCYFSTNAQSPYSKGQNGLTPN